MSMMFIRIPWKDFPEIGVDLETVKGKAKYHKVDVLKKILWYSYEGTSDLIPISAHDVKKIISMNRKNRRPEDLESFKVETKSKE